MSRELEKRIVAWWNDNAFCGYNVEELDDIIELTQDDTIFYYSSITHMLKYHQKQTELHTKYYAEFRKMTGLSYPSQLDDILDNPETLRNYYFNENLKFIYYKEGE